MPGYLTDLFGSTPAVSGLANEETLDVNLSEYLNPANRKQTNIFDAPCHILPSLSTLYSSFMDSVLLKPASAGSESVVDDDREGEASSAETSQVDETTGSVLIKPRLPSFDIQELATALQDSHLSKHYQFFSQCFKKQFSGVVEDDSDSAPSAKEKTPTKTPTKSSKSTSSNAPVAKNGNSTAKRRQAPALADDQPVAPPSRVDTPHPQKTSASRITRSRK